MAYILLGAGAWRCRGDLLHSHTALSAIWNSLLGLLSSSSVGATPPPSWAQNNPAQPFWRRNAHMSANSEGWKLFHSLGNNVRDPFYSEITKVKPAYIHKLDRIYERWDDVTTRSSNSARSRYSRQQINMKDCMILSSCYIELSNYYFNSENGSF